MSDEATNETLKLPQALSIRSIAAAHGLLLDHLRDTDRLVVEVPEDADADLSFVQLMEASRNFAAQNNKTITLKEPAGGQVLQTLRRGGFLSRMDAASRQFWLHERT
ncbi:hypothetical protein [Agrobacterium arsenijevicii]|uniref:STAS domain-containing protein n=1 Tax=Agrobacterium arsenijevicii TaxID=1585697 RepID=A0ABR5D9I9_9HYPH|nr:hypothetical protein RP75_10365 [Agrobacterium arsenijevicii]